MSHIPPRDGKGFKGFLPQLDEFYSTTGKKKISENTDALFRISWMTNSFKQEARRFLLPLQFSVRPNFPEHDTFAEICCTTRDRILQLRSHSWISRLLTSSLSLGALVFLIHNKQQAFLTPQSFRMTFFTHSQGKKRKRLEKGDSVTFFPWLSPFLLLL